MNRTSQNGPSFILPSLLWVTLFAVLPLIYLLYLSFTRTEILRPESQFVGLENYTRFLEHPRLFDSLIRTGLLAGGSTILTLAIGTFAAWVFSYDLPGIRVLRALICLPLFIAPVAAASIAAIIFSRAIGWFPGETWLANPRTAPFVVMIVDAWQWTPLVLVVIVNAIQGLPVSTLEAARLETKSDITIFSLVTFPRVRSALLLVALLRFIESFKMLDLPFSLTRGGPAAATETAGLSMYQIGFQYFDIGPAAAIGVILIIPLLAVGIVFFRRLSRRSKRTLPHGLYILLEGLRRR